MAGSRESVSSAVLMQPNAVRLQSTWGKVRGARRKKDFG